MMDDLITERADSALRTLLDLRQTTQKERIKFGNRTAALERGADEGSGRQLEIVARWHDRLRQQETELDRDIAALVKEYDMYPFVSAVRGVGPMSAAKLIALIDISRSPTVSSLWRYAGYAVMDGERERPKKGERLHYNIRLKTSLYLIAESFLRSSSPYRAIYDEGREHYAANRPDWTAGHQHAAAMRLMIKRFLSHYWLVGRTLAGLPTREPYVVEYKGHTSIDRPEDYGWPEF